MCAAGGSAGALGAGGVETARKMYQPRPSQPNNTKHIPRDAYHQTPTTPNQTDTNNAIDNKHPPARRCSASCSPPPRSACRRWRGPSSPTSSPRWQSCAWAPTSRGSTGEREKERAHAAFAKKGCGAAGPLERSKNQGEIGRLATADAARLGTHSHQPKSI